MSTRAKLIMIGMILSFVVSLSACGKTNTPESNSTLPDVQQSQSQNQTAEATKTFTKEELKKYDGQNGNPAYVAVDGIVYDVTGVKGWNNGQHKGYQAGTDLSAAIKKSPHGTSVLSGLTVVGKYTG